MSELKELKELKSASTSLSFVETLLQLEQEANLQLDAYIRDQEQEQQSVALSFKYIPTASNE